MNEISEKQKRKEKLFYKKIQTDKRFYIEKFLKIRNKKGKLVNFEFNNAQEIFYNMMQETKAQGKLPRFIVLKARQMGLSTYTEGLIFSDTSTNPLKNSLIIAHEEKASQNLFNMSKLYYEELPDVIRPMKKYSNEKALSFENSSNDESEKKKNPGLRSKITVATANTSDTGRSSTIHNLHASEVAFFPNASKTMLALLQSVPDEMNTLVVLESTANGVGDYFHRMWQQSVRGENEFVPVFLPWFTDPTYKKEFSSEASKEQFKQEVDISTSNSDGEVIYSEEHWLKEKHNLTYEQLNWRRWCIANKCGGDEELFKQEYPSNPDEAFIASGRPKFNSTSLKKYQKLSKPGVRGYLLEKNNRIEFLPDPKGYLEIWEYPKKDTYYAIGADVAEGLSHGDYSCGMVGKSDFEVTCMWHGHIDPDLFGDELYKLGKYYNDAYIGVENNNHGLTTLKRLQHREYWNIYYQKTYDRMNDEITSKLGWHSNLKTKPMMIDKLAEFIREMYLGIYSDLTVDEGFSYIIEDNGSTNAQEGCHDDTIMSLGILLQLLLEGKSENYVPEVPEERSGRRTIKQTPEIIDPLFEGDNKEQEVAE